MLNLNLGMFCVAEVGCWHQHKQQAVDKIVPLFIVRLQGSAEASGCVSVKNDFGRQSRLRGRKLGRRVELHPYREGSGVITNVISSYSFQAQNRPLITEALKEKCKWRSVNARSKFLRNFFDDFSSFWGKSPYCNGKMGFWPYQFAVTYQTEG